MMTRCKRFSKWMAFVVTGGVSLVAMVVAVAGVNLVAAPDAAYAAFDVNKLTISGDIRLRGEFRKEANFGGTDNSTQKNDAGVLQRTRLGFAYQTSSDVGFVMQIQDSRILAHEKGDDDGAANAQHNPSQTIGLRQGYMSIKNAGMAGLNLKIGRQRLVIGDQRLIGHFDWDNNGWSFDGIRADYKTGLGTHMLAWIRTTETDGGEINSSGISGGDATGGSDADLLILYNTLNIVRGMTVEPYYMGYFDSQAASATGTTKDGRTAQDQKRHIVGMRVKGKNLGFVPAVGNMMDYTAEIAWQSGEQKDGSAAPIEQSINAWAMAVKVGVTLPVPMKPRLGFEYDYASGSANDREDTGGKNTFEGLFPTNHLHYGYMDRMAWKNMQNYHPSLLLKPAKGTVVKVNYHILRLAQAGDNWYGANQAKLSTTNAFNQAKSVGQEIDIIVAKKLKGGKIGLAVGYGHFFAGEYLDKQNDPVFVDQQGGSSIGNKDQDWGYVSISHKF